MPPDVFMSLPLDISFDLSERVHEMWVEEEKARTEMQVELTRITIESLTQAYAAVHGINVPTKGKPGTRGQEGEWRGVQPVEAEE